MTDYNSLVQQSYFQRKSDENLVINLVNNLQVVTRVAKIKLSSVYHHMSSSKLLLPQVPLVVEDVTATKSSMCNCSYSITLRHGPFIWKLDLTQDIFLSLEKVITHLKDDVKNFSNGLLAQDQINHQNHTESMIMFMNDIFNDPKLQKHHDILGIFEISPLSFIEDLGNKMKEGFVDTKVNLVVNLRSSVVGRLCQIMDGLKLKVGYWKKRWLTLKESSITIINTHSKEITDVLLFDESLQVFTSKSATGKKHMHGMNIVSMIQDRTLEFRFAEKDDLEMWSSAINSAIKGPGNIWTQKKRFDSFAPERKHCSATWFVDGESYMSAVADALMSANDEIFIADWALNPFIFLKRPIDGDLTWRLDQILKQKAEEGVKIHVTLYNAIERATELGADFTEKFLEDLHVNISVILHPDLDDHILEGILIWSHHEKMVIVDQTLAFFGGIDLYFGRWDTHIHRLTDTGQAAIGTDGLPVHIVSKERFQSHIGKDYVNTFVKGLTDPDKPFEEHIDRNDHPRMPWHDIAVCVYGQPARDAARHFIQQHNYYLSNEKKDHPQVSYLLPRKEFTDDEVEKTSKPIPVTNNASCQMIRSLGGWSGGLDDKEASILNAYLYAIDRAEHFIYIENQFLVSSLPDQGVINSVVDHIRAKISQAYKSGKTFRVIICIPLLPEFEDNLGVKDGGSMEVILYWELSTLFREGSLIDKLVNEDKIPEDEIWKYLSINALRNYGYLNHKLVTELVYVHSKLMIVDDKITIIGSANLNDRSLLGGRDSEIAVILEDEELLDNVLFDGQLVKVGKFSHSLRKHIFIEYLGLLDTPGGDKVVEDPIIESFYKDVWINAAKKNTDLFELVFGGKCVPSNSARSFCELEEFKKHEGLAVTDIGRAYEMVSQIKGYLVEFPQRFLENQEMKNVVFPLTVRFFT